MGEGEGARQRSLTGLGCSSRKGNPEPGMPLLYLLIFEESKNFSAQFYWGNRSMESVR